MYVPLLLPLAEHRLRRIYSIECLKYITTGDMPPNTKGGAFIHDPSVCLLSGSLFSAV
jgi:DNA repair protein RAD50